MRVVITTLNSKYVHASLAPWCLQAAVEQFCSKVSSVVVEGTVNEPLEAVRQRILAEQPQVAAFSCYIWNIAATKSLIAALKAENPALITVVGGPEVSYDAAAVLQNPNIDYLISGEGEQPFSQLLNALAAQKPLDIVPGLCYRDKNGVQLSEPFLHHDMQLPNPYTPQFLKQLQGRIVYLETSRGCPYSCAFCLSGRCGRVRLLAIAEAEKRILQLSAAGAKVIKLVDRTFNANRAHCNAILRFILAHYGTEIPKGTCFHFEIAGDILTDETVALLKTAPVGAIQLEIGLQSFHEKTLQSIHRKTDVNRLKKRVSQLISFGNMHIHIDLIAGLPQEDFNTFQQSFHTAYALRPQMLQLGFLKLLKGAPMREQPEHYPCVYSSEPPYEVQSTPWLTAAEIARLHAVEDVLERLYNSGRFHRTVPYLERFFQTPFALFAAIAQSMGGPANAGISLNDYAEKIYRFGRALPGVHSDLLRDLMLCDLMTTVKNYQIPQFLKRPDLNYKTKRRLMEQTHPTPVGVRRTFALLYAPPAAVAVDYTKSNPVTGEFPLLKINFPN